METGSNRFIRIIGFGNWVQKIYKDNRIWKLQYCKFNRFEKKNRIWKLDPTDLLEESDFEKRPELHFLRTL